MSTTTKPNHFFKILELTKEIDKLVEIDNMAYNYSSTPVLYPQNIQKILLGLDIGENPDYKFSVTAKNNAVEMVNNSYQHLDNTYRRNIMQWVLYAYDSNLNFIPKTQAKALSDKWFSFREVNSQAVSSLWDSGEEGQVQVLEELLEVLKGVK